MGMTRSGDGSHPIGPGATTETEFDTVRKGYRPEQVDTTVRELRWQLEVAERGRREAEERAATLSASLESARAGAPDSFGMRAEKIIRMAEHDAGRRREEAETEAARIVAAAQGEAEAEAERIVAEAHEAAEKARSEAVAAVARVHADADTARRETDQCADTAAAMHEHVLGLRSAVRDEIARLHAAMAAELRTLDELVARPGPSDAAPMVELPTQREQPTQEHAEAAAGSAGS